MTWRTAERCGVAGEEDCQGIALKSCFACGNPVCGGCSRRINWHRFKRVRVCDRCRDERDRFANEGKR